LQGGVAVSEDVKGAGKSFVDTMLREGWVEYGLGGGTCPDEEKVLGEAVGVEC
jgi:hypothetical protein